MLTLQTQLYLAHYGINIVVLPISGSRPLQQITYSTQAKPLLFANYHELTIRTLSVSKGNKRRVLKTRLPPTKRDP